MVDANTAKVYIGWSEDNLRAGDFPRLDPVQDHVEEVLTIKLPDGAYVGKNIAGWTHVWLSDGTPWDVRGDSERVLLVPADEEDSRDCFRVKVVSREKYSVPEDC